MSRMAAHQESATQVRAILATYAQAEDLIRIGAYVAGIPGHRQGPRSCASASCRGCVRSRRALDHAYNAATMHQIAAPGL